MEPVHSMKARESLVLVALAAIWGAAFLFMRIAAAPFGPVPLVFVRVSIAAVCLTALLGVQGELSQLWLHSRRLWIVGLLNAAIPFSLLSFAALNITAGFSALINSLTPLMVALVGMYGFGQRLDRSQWIGMALSMGGVGILSWGKMSFKAGGSGWAIVAAIIATVCYGLGAQYSRRHLKGVSPVVSSAGSLLGASLALLPLTVLQWPRHPLQSSAWGAAIGLGLLCTGVAYLVYYHLINTVGPHRAASVTFLVPMFAMGWSAMFLHEELSSRMLLASGVILLGTALATGLLKPDFSRRSGDPIEPTGA